ncbi:hypothetical protein MMC19_007571 [Ptychographa xylographoides]|nr:hypothetical protein [Ptychographa xylographoides]
MASRIKKLFHRKEGDSTPPQETSSPPRRRFSSSNGSNPTLRHSLYETTTPGGAPQVGGYPQGGNHTSVMPGRQSATYVRGGQNPSRSMDHGRPQDDALVSDLSRLNLDGGRSSTIRPVPSSQQGPVGLGPSSDDGDVSTRNQPGLGQAGGRNQYLPTSTGDRNNTVVDHGTHQPQSSAATREPVTGQSQPEQLLSRKRSIPRKEVGSASAFQSSEHSNTNPSPTKPHIRQSSLNKPLPRFQGQAVSTSEPQPTTAQENTLLTSPLSKPIRGEDVLDRAQAHSFDTQVIEKVAPAVVHETVNQKVHHIRHEEITREIHQHEYYHRILPVIDVEVLPPRHFLPVEGGGLVEVSADEVPGRGKNWVIAETASQIPSAGPLPKESRDFTARQFNGTDGDERRYITPEGFERTEQTWIHPPERQTLGKLTGQTWPMEFENHTAAIQSASSASATRSPGKLGKQKGILKQSTSQPTEEERLVARPRGNASRDVEDGKFD